MRLSVQRSGGRQQSAGYLQGTKPRKYMTVALSAALCLFAAPNAVIAEKAVASSTQGAKETYEKKEIADSKTSVTTQAVGIQLETQKLNKTQARDNEVLKAVQAALASTEQRLQQSEVARIRLVDELKTMHGQLTACQARINAMTNDDSRKLMLLADKGEAVLFREVGEAQVAVLNGRSVLRFPLTAATRADRALLGIKSERYLNGSFAYYIVDTKLLNY